MTVFEQLGGTDGVRRLVDHFYDVMDADPEVAHLRALHNDDLEFDRVKLTDFLSGWFGGPKLYWHKTTPDELRRRHAHKPVGEPERLAWMRCMTSALSVEVSDEDLRGRLWRRFDAASHRIVNQVS